MVGLYLVATGLALFFGLVAVTANPIIIGVFVGMLVGAALMLRPTWMVWLILVAGLLVAGVVPIWAEGVASKAVWGISGLGFALMGAVFLSVATRQGAAANTPAFVWLALAFVLYSVFSTLVYWPSTYEILGGFKRYFQVTGLLFALAWLPVGERDVRRWRKFFILVALIQLPWAVYELVRLVPIREGFRYAYPGMVPIDVVAGTFGANMRSGGANAEMATFLIIVLAFLLAHLRQKTLGLGKLALLAPFVLMPLFMGETKVVVLLLPMMFLVLYRRELLARPHYALVGLVAGSLLTVAAGYAYLQVTEKPLERLVDETLRYNVYEKGHGGRALNRTTVLTFWGERQGLADPAGALLGHGLGTAHDDTGGEMSRRYAGYGIGLTAASSLLWEQGVLGTALFLAMLAFAWRAAGQMQRAGVAPPWARADAAAIQAALPIFAFYLAYRSSLLEILSFQIVFWLMLGYLAWLTRRYPSGTAS